jgi:hypothetical protein
MDILRNSNIIQDPSRARQSEKKIVDGIIHSGVLNSFQVAGIDGLVHSAMGHRERPRGEKNAKPILHASKKPATPYKPGFVKYPGSGF